MKFRKGQSRNPGDQLALNAKQQRFVAEYLKDLNATQVVRAGYSERTAKQIGSRLLTNVDAAAAVAAAQEKRAKKLELSAEAILRDLEEIRKAAVAEGQFDPAVRAVELLRQAAANRFEKTAEMKTDTHLNVLRSRADFKKLLADLEAAGKPRRLGGLSTGLVAPRQG